MFTVIGAKVNKAACGLVIWSSW